MSSVSKDKDWPRDIIDDPDISSVDEEKILWIYCQVCTKEVNMRYAFKGSIWNEHILPVS